MARQSKSAQRAQKRADLEHQRREAARKRTIRNTTLGIGAALVVVVGLVLLWPSPNPEDVAADAASNTSATGWDLPELDGEGRVRLADFAGKPTVALFFANWCTICEVEVPQMLDLSRVIGADVNFVGINMMDNAGGLGDAEKWGIAGEWPLARDVGNGNNSALAVGAFGARGSPLHVVYNESGDVVFTNNGALTPNQLVEILTERGLLTA